MERIASGVPGLDEILGGGVPKNHIVLVSGTCGTGKTILCGQFIYEGLNNGENGVYLSLEEQPESIKDSFSRLGMNFDKYEKEGKLTFIKYDPYHVEGVFDILENTITGIGAKRVVIDSISALGMHIKDKGELRRMIFNLSLVLRKMDTTTVMTSEIIYGQSGISRYGVEEFVADSVIVLYYEKSELMFSRTIQVWKVRGSNHSKKLHTYKITNKGIVVYPTK
ncbi:MAG TPA: KaiC domain-containing protein [Candidatus Aenigmarchaeota archaeon]|nr:MAG: KaiC domain-containing protein [Candidatus Aenigmarchaeota archaeon]HDD46501.1 KaiC domain-containing protein [Candidatus Aenigmarchaeota archaeon]